MRKQEGITLIALVITIIVLLILAGVTIAMLTGENGLLSRATSTKQASDLGTARELISLHVNDCVALYYDETFVQETDSPTYSDVTAAVNAGIQAAKNDGSWPSNASITGSASPYTLTYTPTGEYQTVTVDSTKGGAITFGTLTKPNP